MGGKGSALILLLLTMTRPYKVRCDLVVGAAVVMLVLGSPNPDVLFWSEA